MQTNERVSFGGVSTYVGIPIVLGALIILAGCTSETREEERSQVTANEAVALNQKTDGYRGIWYMNQPLDNKYRFKYSGGLATYTAKHRPFAIYSEKAEKTFFVYGGTTKGFNEHLDLAAGGLADTTGGLLHMVSYYDHETDRVARPTILLDKKTWDAHDNPVLSLDDEGYLWIFSTSHGRSRPSYIHRSTEPYSIDSFERISATRMKDGERVPIRNFSYMQAWHMAGRGFFNFFTRYDYPVNRTPAYMTSTNGREWSAWQRIATIGEGHYQVSIASPEKAATSFNYHPEGKGVNWRTNLYYVETEDFGESWQAADGTALDLPLEEIQNPALVHDYAAEDLLVYLNDIRFDAEGRPVLLFVTSSGFASGPENDPRTWRTARWTGSAWEIHPITTSDNNYDMGPLYIEEDGTWRIIAPTEPGPQSYNPGGEIGMWVSDDQGRSWTKSAQLTTDSPYNHTYVRRPVDAHPEFYALWADGHGRQPSESRLYFATKTGEVYMLPRSMDSAAARPKPLE